MASKIHLYLDDTGSRNPDHAPDAGRRDGMDCFGLGGKLINGLLASEDRPQFGIKYSCLPRAK
jgi:hypothetical protein